VKVVGTADDRLSPRFGYQDTSPQTLKIPSFCCANFNWLRATFPKMIKWRPNGIQFNYIPTVRIFQSVEKSRNFLMFFCYASEQAITPKVNKQPVRLKHKFFNWRNQHPTLTQKCRYSGGANVDTCINLLGNYLKLTNIKNHNYVVTWKFVWKIAWIVDMRRNLLFTISTCVNPSPKALNKPFTAIRSFPNPES
jgi:hypothetical protein